MRGIVLLDRGRSHHSVTSALAASVYEALSGLPAMGSFATGLVMSLFNVRISWHDSGRPWVIVAISDRIFVMFKFGRLERLLAISLTLPDVERGLQKST
jgi:anti-anti-sigma regulatory factor